MLGQTDATEAEKTTTGFDAAQTTLQHKSFTTATSTASAGEFSALVAVFNNVDKGGDGIMPGAFTKTLAAWRASGDPVPSSGRTTGTRQTPTSVSRTPRT